MLTSIKVFDGIFFRKRWANLTKGGGVSIVEFFLLALPLTYLVLILILIQIRLLRLRSYSNSPRLWSKGTRGNGAKFLD
jgi:hypothetical protein